MGQHNRPLRQNRRSSQGCAGSLRKRGRPRRIIAATGTTRTGCQRAQSTLHANGIVERTKTRVHPLPPKGGRRPPGRQSSSARSSIVVTAWPTSDINARSLGGLGHCSCSVLASVRPRVYRSSDLDSLFMSIDAGRGAITTAGIEHGPSDQLLRVDQSRPIQPVSGLPSGRQR
jgi:hypothetical protein